MQPDRTDAERAGKSGIENLDLARFEVILLRMVIAGLLGAFLGYRLWRRLLPNTLPPARETAQAQTLIAIAGALMVVVIGRARRARSAWSGWAASSAFARASRTRATPR